MTNTSLEIVNQDHPRGPFRAAVFDFDGTLSLLRRNWQDVMIPMMVEVLGALETDETPEQLYRHVEEFVMRLNGRQTIYQMIQLADEVRQRGGEPLEPLQYKDQYHDLLWKQVSQRVAQVQSGKTPAEEMTVPESETLLQRLRDRGVTLYLASGTDLKYVQNELEVLGLHEYFGSRVYGALDDYKKFSKAMVIQQIVSDTSVSSEQLVGFGDGFVEIEEIKKFGGLAIGVASDEEHRQGINDWKRQRLIRAGADLVVGDYRGQEALLQAIGLA